MARPDKVAVVTDVRDRLTDATATVLTEYRGLTVPQMQELRARLRQTDAEYRVIKNTLARRAAADAGFDVPDDVLVGPTAITFCAGDPVATAKVLRAFSREHPSLVIKGGIFEGNVLGAEETLRLADLASREELLAQVAGLLEAVLAQPARLAQASLTKFARLLAAYADKRSQAGEAAEPEAADA
jgi:large subunit ribosomal protein L10